MKGYIAKIASHLPEQQLSNADVAQRINAADVDITGETIDSLIGPCTRRYASATTQASDLAVSAAEKVLRGEQKEDIDLLIFASASADLIEPATANIVQHKLGLNCAAFDIKNACNSVTTAMEVANSLIRHNIPCHALHEE